MGMVHEVLSPGMQDAYEADTCSETVIAQFQEGFGDRTKVKIVHHLLVSQHQGVQFRRDGENDMKVVYGQEVLSPGLDPLLFS